MTATITPIITVEGMTCEHCQQTVDEALRDVEGVEDVSVDREAERANVEGEADADDLVSAVEGAGYSAKA